MMARFPSVISRTDITVRENLSITSGVVVAISPDLGREARDIVISAADARVFALAVLEAADESEKYFREHV